MGQQFDLVSLQRYDDLIDGNLVEPGGQRIIAAHVAHTKTRFFDSGQIAVHEAEKLPAVALAARPGVGGQGVDIPARGGSAAGQGQRLGQQGQHGGQPPLLHHLNISCSFLIASKTVTS